VAHPTNRKWVITPIISGLTLLIPFITGAITHLLSGMSHQVGNTSIVSSMEFWVPNTFSHGRPGGEKVPQVSFSKHNGVCAGAFLNTIHA
jgi:hypothetical protein